RKTRILLRLLHRRLPHRTSQHRRTNHRPPKTQIARARHSVSWLLSPMSQSDISAQRFNLNTPPPSSPSEIPSARKASAPPASIAARASPFRAPGLLPPL